MVHLCGAARRSERAPRPPWPTWPTSCAGGVVTRAELEAFSYDGRPFEVIDQSRGIRNPAELAATLSILSQPAGPYDDEETADGLLRCDYRRGDRAYDLGRPLILLRSIAPGVFVPVWLAMYKIHHAACDRGSLGVRPEYRVEIRADVLLEVGGPMLRYGLEEMHVRDCTCPARSPNCPTKMRLRSGATFTQHWDLLARSAACHSAMKIVAQR